MVILVALIAGILLGGCFTPPMLLLSSSSALLGAGLLLALKTRRFQTGFFLLAVLVFIFGIFNVQKQNYFPDKKPNIADYADGGIITVEGFVADHSASLPDREVIILRCLRIA
ncbi:MAG TPA: hypothetical protein P5040_04085, partial [Smithella sp.]|nr:hypothetical protein [Smithella sp.]